MDLFMNHRYKQLCFFLALLILGCSQMPDDPLKLADPMIGTDGTGHTFPGATTPFGMVQLSPSNDFKSWAWCSGYHYTDSVLKGFAHNHISGAGLSGLGDILLMPATGDIRVNPGSEERPETGYRSRFSHDNEFASPGYYRVLLEDYNITAELTASQRVGFHRYTFHDGGDGHVIIDPTHGLDQSVIETEVAFVSDRMLRGFKHSAGDDGLRTVYFYAWFSKPFIDKGVAVDDRTDTTASKAKSKNAKAFVRFDPAPGEAIEVKVAMSHVSYEGAKTNFEAEAVEADFDGTWKAAEKSWEEKLKKFRIKGLDPSEERVFYTAVYHSFISPNLISDVDGNFIVEGEQYRSEEPHYSNFSTWDTYRALHPLFCLVDQKSNSRFVKALTSRYHDQQVGLPLWELLGYDNKCMIGYNAVSPMVEAVLKDVDGVDPEAVYEAVTAAANNTSPEKSSVVYGLNGMKGYTRLHYVPAEVNSSVSKTTEQNYYDWAIARLAAKLGKPEDAEQYKARSLGYRNLFRPDKKLLWPKYSNGLWREMDTTRWYDYEMNYVSGNVWGYSSYVPHDVEGLAGLIGGRKAFGHWLDKIFSDSTRLKGNQHVDISGFIGKYGHGDEPSHHMAYLYNHAGQPWKGQKIIRKIMDDFYTDRPDGLVNNEDLGQMSAWYIFSALGFYPVNPAALVYEIGSPNVKEAVLNLENGNRFRVVARNNSKRNRYVQSVRLNGQVLEKTYLTHDQIMKGGLLEFEMGRKPNKQWGTEPGMAAPSAVELNDKSKLSETLPAPYDVNGAFVFEDKLKITLACKEPGADIHYTLDGTNPDEKSRKYREPFDISESTRLRAVAVVKGKNPGMIMDQHYYEGIDLSTENGNAKVTLNPPPTREGDDGARLVDGVFETSYRSDENWCVWQGDDAGIVIDLGEKQRIRSVTVSYLDHTGLWIFPPRAIRLYTSAGGKDFRMHARKTEINSSVTFNPFIRRVPLKFPAVETQYLKIEMENSGEIPEWHKGAGKPALLYAGEIIVR